MGATGKKGKLKKGDGGATYSTTGTKASDWGIDPLKPYKSADPTRLQVKKNKPKGPNSVNA